MPTVLVVDDAAVDRKLVGGLLTKGSGFDVQFAASGEEALERLPVIAPAAIVTDLVMPGMSGLELVARVVSALASIQYRTRERTYLLSAAQGGSLVDRPSPRGF